MTITVSYNKGSGKYYNTGIGNIPISFSSLRFNFKEASSGSVSASELLRNTNNSETNPIVPDATENSNISSSKSNWKVSQFYSGTIKYYDLIQDGTYDNSTNTNNYGLDIGIQSWNTNLSKIVRKTFYITGTIGSIVSSKVATYLNATSYNLTINVSGIIQGAGGTRNSGNGGSAMSITSAGGKVEIYVQENSQIYGGGGGGALGADGTKGPDGPCWSRTNYTTGRDCNCEFYPDCGSSNSPININGIIYNSYGWSKYGGNNPNGGCNCFIWCRNTCISKTLCLKYDPYRVGGAPGGTGGAGGLGQGYTQTKTDAITTINATNGPTAGGAAGCPTYATSGTGGQAGGNGGDWAKNGSNTTRPSTGGSSGSAIIGTNYIVTGPGIIGSIKGAR